MKNRRKSREAALQALYYMDIRRNLSSGALSLYSRCFPVSDNIHPFFKELTWGVMKYRTQIDNVIERFSDHWKISRMSCVDRNVLRIAVFELLFCDDIPVKVSINEAIDIAKKFGTEDSGAFVNGILDSARIALDNKEIAVDPEFLDEVPDHVASDSMRISGEINEENSRSFSRVKGRPGVVKRRASIKAPEPDIT